MAKTKSTGKKSDKKAAVKTKPVIIDRQLTGQAWETGGMVKALPNTSKE